MTKMKVKDTDYLFLSTRIRAMEGRLLSQERMDRMLEARSAEDAAKVLSECGGPELNALSPDGIDAALAAERERVFADLAFSAPEPEILDVFRVRYDYLNAKVLLMAEAVGAQSEGLLVDAGRVGAKDLEEAIRSGELRSVPGELRHAVEQAREVLGASGDPQLADFILDRAYFADMAQIARDSGSEFLQGYVRLSVDTANLRAAVRTLRMGKNAEFLKGVLVPGGEVAEGRILSAVTAGAALQELYARTPRAEAAETGAAAVAGGGLTKFEKQCDDALGHYLAGAKFVPFGQAPVIGYLCAKETELTNLRVILSGRLAGLEADTIRERLREAYV